VGGFHARGEVWWAELLALVWAWPMPHLGRWLLVIGVPDSVALGYARFAGSGSRLRLSDYSELEVCWCQGLTAGLRCAEAKSCLVVVGAKVDSVLS